MSEKSEQLTTENAIVKKSLTDPFIPSVEVKDIPTMDETQKLQFWREKRKSSGDQDIPGVEAEEPPTTDTIEKKQAELEIELPPEFDKPFPTPEKVNTKKTRGKKPQPTTSNKRDDANVHMLLERCRHLSLSLFYRENAPVRSLGFTSSIAGEGKSFLALVTAQVLAHDSTKPVTLVECNWDHPSQHEYFGIPATPGLAEWLRGMCDEEDIRYQVDSNLTVIPAGNGAHDAVKLLNQVQQHGLLNTFTPSNGLYIVDLPPIITTGYGSLAASLLESIVIVVRAQVIPDRMIAETCSQLKDVPIHGLILNQDESRIPRWLRQLL